jgi:hypothetical protein
LPSGLSRDRARPCPRLVWKSQPARLKSSWRTEQRQALRSSARWWILLRQVKQIGGVMSARVVLAAS